MNESQLPDATLDRLEEITCPVCTHSAADHSPGGVTCWGKITCDCHVRQLELYEPVLVALLAEERKATAIAIAEETLPLLNGHVGCVSRAQDSLRRYLPTPVDPDVAVDDVWWNGSRCSGCGARLDTVNDRDHFIPMSTPDAQGYQCRSSYAATGETPSQAWCKKFRSYV